MVAATVHLAATTAALARSRRRLSDARDEERRALRRELHDGLGPALAGIGLGLQAARNQLAVGPGDRRRPARPARRRARAPGRGGPRHGPRAAPARARRPRPRARARGAGRPLRDRGVAGRARPRRPGVGWPRWTPPVATAAYAIVSEAVRNVHRHARTDTCAVRLVAEPAELVVVVADRGAGVDPAAPAGSASVSMRERAEGWAAASTVGAAPGGGTRSRCASPRDRDGCRIVTRLAPRRRAHRTRGRPAGHGRRRPSGVPHGDGGAAVVARRHHGRGRGRVRRRGGGGRGRAPARRRHHGPAPRRHVGHRRHPRDRAAAPRRRRAGRDDDGRRRLGVRRHAGRRPRLPAEGGGPGRGRAGRAGGRQRRGAARPRRGRPGDGLHGRRPHRRTGAVPRPDRPRARGPRPRRPRAGQRARSPGAWRSARRPSATTCRTSSPSWPWPTAPRRSSAPGTPAWAPTAPDRGASAPQAAPTQRSTWARTASTSAGRTS